MGRPGGDVFLSDEALRYYELEGGQGPRQMTAWAEHEGSGGGLPALMCWIRPPEPGWPIGSSVPAGNSFSQKKLYSSIFLTGKGFGRTDWAQSL